MDQKKANKGKSPEQLKQEKKAAKNEALRSKREEALKQKLQTKMMAKMMKDPRTHPGFTYPMSKQTEKIVEAIKNYQDVWDELDALETRDVKEKFVTKMDQENVWAEVKLALRPTVDDDMRNELKKLKTALKQDYETLEQPWPDDIAPQQFPRIPKPKKVKDTISDKIVEKMVDLALKGYLKHYPRTKLEDFKGEPNFAGDDLRCNFTRAMPYSAETRNAWWERCRNLTHGLNKIMLVGPKESGKSLLVYAMASLNDAVLFELQIAPAYFVDSTVGELTDLSKSIVACAKAVQPAVIYIKYIHRLYYTKVPTEEPAMDKNLINKYLIKKLTKFKKSDNVTLIVSCIDPWMTKSAKLLKIFPTVVMMPITTYTITFMALKEWIMDNRMVPPDLDITSLARVLKDCYSYGQLQKGLRNFLSAERIARIAGYSLDPREVFDYIVNDENVKKVEYDKYLKWYKEKTQWGIQEQKHIQAQLEFQEVLKKYAEKNKKKKKATSAASSAVSSMASLPE